MNIYYKRFLILILLTFVFGLFAKQAEAVSLYFTKGTNTTPLTQVSFAPNEQTTLNLYLNAGTTNINGFDMTLSFGNGIQVTSAQEGQNVNRFNQLLFNSLDPVGKTYHLVKVSTNTSSVINGILQIAVLSITAGNTNASGSFSFPSLTVVSPTSDNALSIAPPPTLSYTVAVPPTATPLPTATPIPPTSTPMPTTTPVPGATLLAFTLTFQGIGTGGNALPNPPQKTVTVQLYNAQDQQVGPDKVGQVNFASGNYTGTIDVGIIPSGNYTVKVKGNKYLRRRVPGILAITTGTNTVSPVSLIVGDVNNDNKIDALDFGIQRNCFGSMANSPTCGSFKTVADLDDNGIIDEVDINLFVRSISTQVGD